MVSLTYRLAELYAADPFTTIEQARTSLGLGRSQMAALLQDFPGSPEGRDRLLAGPSAKYWQNTILPLETAGVLDAVLENKVRYPYRVGLYPGPTCMFRCSFCVRVTGERYPADALADGNDLLERVIDELPQDDPHRLYFSGGLEPLTNPGTERLAARAAARGFKVALYTNAFTLTPRTLSSQLGLWDLAGIRVSLYGLSEEEYVRTTGKRGAFARVAANLREFLHARHREDRRTHLGLNYIILPGAVHRLPLLVDYIADLNRAAPDRPIDFVTLREDYSGRTSGKIADAERADLRTALREFADRAAKLTPTLRVDRGYALESVAAGVDAEMLRVPASDLRPTAHPQAAVQIDLLGDVYLYREAGFPGLKGADRYIAGRIGPDTGLIDVMEDFVGKRQEIAPLPGDEQFLDGFDQVVTARLRQLEADVRQGWPDHRGLIRMAA
ncbi:dTDP-4-amino-4,6-dideoxy-D-glucose ammonia-lyase [Micromonospora echinospora]|uniref:dTDP-4-amino-4,6-dideoxy-D-glucose ammonia-lyase n=1 Tax=Micromonospora echinospora TaxID=1877 RepID=UPI003433F88B